MLSPIFSVHAIMRVKRASPSSPTVNYIISIIYCANLSTTRAVNGISTFGHINKYNKAASLLCSIQTASPVKNLVVKNLSLKK